MLNQKRSLFKAVVLWCVSTILLSLAVYGQTDYVQVPYGNDNRIENLGELLHKYNEDRGIMSRTFNLPFCKEHYEKWKDFYTDWQIKLDDVDFGSMALDARIDYHILKNRLEYELRALEIEKKENDEIQEFLPFAKDIIQLENNRRMMKRFNSEETAAILVRITNLINEMREKFKNRDIQIHLVKKAADMSRRLQQILKHWFDFYNGYDPLFTWWAEEPYKKAEESFNLFIEYLSKNVTGVPEESEEPPVVGLPIGREALINELNNSMIDYTPEELIEIGKKEYAWCEAEMIKASKELGYGKDWMKALEYVKTRHVAPGEQPYLIRELALEAIDFVEKNDLITVPQLAKDTWKIGMMSPRRQLVNPFFTGGEVISVSFPTNTMTHEQKMMSMRGNNKHFSRATVHHELIPGHHLQGFMTSRYKSYRRRFGTPFWGEGWPLHWEMLLWDLGFPKSPEDKIGMLFWKMHRCARIIFSLSFHLELMTPQECIDMLVNRVGHERANAVAEVRRSFEGSYSPLYQCAYLLGGLQMRSLYHECTGSGNYTPKEFHDAVMKENSIAIKLLRAKLLNQRLEKDSIPEWKFYKK